MRNNLMKLTGNYVTTAASIKDGITCDTIIHTPAMAGNPFVGKDTSVNVVYLIMAANSFSRHSNRHFYMPSTFVYPN